MDFNFDFQFDKPVIGVDEVGRGSWAGPVMAGAALLNYKLPIDKRLNDSKKLTPKIRMEIFENLTENHIFGVGEVSNCEIDKIGILKATFKAMEIAIQNLLDRIKLSVKPIILIDGTIMPDFFKRFDLKVKLIKKGDALSPSIAAASVIAKQNRDNLMINMDKTFSGYEFQFNKGYGSKKHRERLFLLGPTQFHRMSFRPMKNMK